jgi:hypothetical protein
MTPPPGSTLAAAALVPLTFRMPLAMASHSVTSTVGRQGLQMAQCWSCSQAMHSCAALHGMLPFHSSRWQGGGWLQSAHTRRLPVCATH